MITSFVGFGRSDVVDLRGALIHEFFDHPTRDGPDGVEAAVDFLVDQETQAVAPPLHKSVVESDIPRQGRNPPICRVTHERIRAEGVFERTNATAPYNRSCFCARARYHVAAACDSLELYEWRWTLRSAQQKRCEMPDPSPTKAAKLFRRHTKTLQVVMLGLSFMGQPFQSLGCLYERLVSDGFVYGARRSRDSPGAKVSLAEVRKDGGQCLGLDQDHIPQYFPETPAKSAALPTQNLYSCTTDHAQFEYTDDHNVKVRVCFKYLFNMKKNVKPNERLPCDLSWRDVDVVLHLFPNRVFRDVYLKRTNAPRDLRTKIVSVLDIYQATLERQLFDAFVRAGLPKPSHANLLAQPLDCSRRDVHYALPGFTDHAVQVWFSLIATGLDNATTFYGRES